MIKAVLMDVGQTIVNNRIVNLDNGIKAVYDLDKSNNKISYDEYYRVYNSLKKLTFYEVRKINSEVDIKVFLKTLNEITNLKVDLDIEELEYYFQSNVIVEELIDNVVDLLKYFKERNIVVIAVSNSCMGSKAIARELAEFGVLEYISEVISSCDILVRKPRKEIFDFAVGKIRKIDNTIKQNEIAFIGNDFMVDVVGASNANLVPIWFNEKNEKAEYDNLSYFNVNNYLDLIEIFKEIGK